MHRRPYRLLRKFSTSASVSSKSNVTLGIRREDPARIWERRTPLTPEAVNYLVSKKNVAVDVEHCDRRVFPDSEYIKAGATIKPKLDDAHIIIGIKETPLPELITSPISSPTSPNALRERTHLMFSHTIKGQTYNTPLLARFVGPSNSPPDPLSSRLIDYELLTSEKDGKRSVGFGWFAGVAGALESLSAMAHSHLTLGIASPFLYTPRPHTHPSLDSLRSALRDIGKRIAEEGTPKTLGPFVIGLTGTGKVSQGCLDILKELPIEHVRVKDLHGLVTNPDTDLRKIYLVHAKAEDYLVRTDVASGSYDRTHYYANPSSYKSVFADKVAPYLTLFLNGTGWSSAFPRLMSNPQLTTAMEKAESLGGLRFRNVGDISCDIEGGLQFLTRATTLSDPFYMVYPPKEGESGVTESSAVEDTTMAKKRVGVNMMSVDILPAALPMDASMHFSKVLLPYLEEVVGWYSGETTQQGEEKRALDRATVAKDGKLEENHKWLQGNVDGFYAENPHKASASTSTSGVFTPTMQPKPQSTLTTPSAPTPTPTKPTSHLPGAGMKKKRVLMLGSGMVAGPAVDEIAKRGDVELVIGD